MTLSGLTVFQITKSKESADSSTYGATEQCLFIAESVSEAGPKAPPATAFANTPDNYYGVLIAAL